MEDYTYSLTEKMSFSEMITLVSHLVSANTELEKMQQSENLPTKVNYFYRATLAFENTLLYVEYLNTFLQASSAHIADTVFSDANVVLAGVNNFIVDLNKEVDVLALQLSAKVDQLAEFDNLEYVNTLEAQGIFNDIIVKWVKVPDSPMKESTLRLKLSKKGYTLDKLYTHEQPYLTYSLYDFQYSHTLRELRNLAKFDFKAINNELNLWLELDNLGKEIMKILSNKNPFEKYPKSTLVDYTVKLLDKYEHTLTELSKTNKYMNSCVDLGYMLVDTKKYLFEDLGQHMERNILLDMKDDLTALYKEIYPDFSKLKQHVNTMFPVHFYPLETSQYDAEDIEDGDEIIVENYAIYIFGVLVMASEHWLGASDKNPLKNLLGVYLLKFTLEDTELFTSNKKVYAQAGIQNTEDITNGTLIGYLYVLDIAKKLLDSMK